MKDWERSSDNKHCRELTLFDNGMWWSFIYWKKFQRLQIKHSNDYYETQSKHRVTPNIPIKHLLWLMNGSETILEQFEREGTVIEIDTDEEAKQ
jgi:hypothetical protein